MIFDLSDRTQLELTRSDRAKFLHGFCTNDIKGLTPGRGCEAFVCNIQGKVLGRIFVFCTESSLWIDSEPGQEDVLFAHLDRYLINEDVQIHRRTADYGDYYLSGSSTAVLNDVLAAPAAQLMDQPLLSHVTIAVEQARVQIRHVDWTGEAGWLISAPRAVPAADLLREPAADVGHWNALRIDAGFPLYGVDITSENLAQEVGRTSRCISFQKGCYLGQEPIARIDAMGHVNRELCRLQITGDDVPPAGTALLDAPAGTQIGVITSAAKMPDSPHRSPIVALGYLRTKYCSTGTSVQHSAPSLSQIAIVR